MAASRHEAEELCRRLNDLGDRHDSLGWAALEAVRVTRPIASLFPDHLRLLSGLVRETVMLGARRGAATVLAAA